MPRVATARMRAIPSATRKIVRESCTLNCNLISPAAPTRLGRTSDASRARTSRSPLGTQQRARCTPPWLEHPKSMAHRQLFVRVEWRILAWSRCQPAIRGVTARPVEHGGNASGPSVQRPPRLPTGRRGFSTAYFRPRSNATRDLARAKGRGRGQRALVPGPAPDSAAHSTAFRISSSAFS